jgi:hypothetical protein
VARLLGARHLAQATLTALVPRPGVFVAGAGVDALHAASMVMLVAADRTARRAALTDAVVEAAFAASGLAVPSPAVARRAATRAPEPPRWSASVEAPEGDLVQQQPERGRRRDRHQGADDAHQGPADQHGHD